MKAYIADVRELYNWEQLAKAYDIVDGERRRKVDRLRFVKDKSLSLGAGLLLKKVLKIEGNSHAEIAYTAKGKPFLKDNKDFYFNLSHSGTLVLCVTADVPVGCDIEYMSSVPSTELIGMVLSKSEQDAIKMSDDVSVMHYFYKLWTGKESWLKLKGEGLGRDLREISLQLPFGTEYIDGCRYTFMDILCDLRYQATVCTEGVYDSEKLTVIDTTLF